MLMPKKQSNVKRQKCIIYSRVCGWYTGVSQFNKGKTAEWNDRVVFTNEEKIGA